MPSRREQVQSYQFAVQRVVTALVAGEADPAQTPLRRLVSAGFASVMVAVLALAAVGVFGLITGRGGAGWRDGSAVILERETGAAYVLRDGALIPAANFTSALLVQQSSRTVTVPRAQLAGVPRTPMVGIPNAPDALPPAASLLTGAWTLCTGSASTPSGEGTAITQMRVGTVAPPGQPLGDGAILVRQAGSDNLHLVWRGHRYRIEETSVVLEALALRQEPQIVVGTAWLNGLAEGQPIRPLSKDRRGEPFGGLPEVPDARVGQVLVVGTAGVRVYYLVGTTLLQPVTQLQAEVILADPDTVAAYQGLGTPQARPLSANAANRAPRAEAPPPSTEQPPPQRPQMVRLPRPDLALCATVAGDAGAIEVSIDTAPLTAEGVPTAGRTGLGAALVDRVLVEAGLGAVVAAEPSPGANTGTLFLVTDLGVRYAIPSPQVLNMLGYGAVQPVPLPASIVAKLPEGPTLDPDAAAKPI